MKRQFTTIGLTAIVFSLLLSLPIAVATPMRRPRAQAATESEPNNSFAEADPFTDSIIGSVTNTPIEETVDYLQTDTTEDLKYEASLIIDSPEGLRLRMVLFNEDQQRVTTSSASSTNVDLSWTARSPSHYFRIEAVTVSTSTVKTADYRLDVFESAEPTDTPTPTNTPTASPTPEPEAWDAYEPNDSFPEAYTLAIATSVAARDLNFVPYEDRPGPDQDWFAFYARQGGTYEAGTENLMNVDTTMEVLDANGGLVESSDNEGGGFASRAVWVATYTGYYYIHVENAIDTRGPDDVYDLVVDEVEAAPTVTPRPVRATADECEPNPDFESACVLPLNQTQTFNFVPAFGPGPDNDFYRVWVKPGLHYRCETSDLSPGVDPNMIVFTGPSWDQSIGGNDDIAPCNFNSAFNYYATYSGWLYVLVGTGDRTPSDVLDSDYSLTCEKSTTPFMATSTPRAQPTRDPSGKLPTAEPTVRQPTPTPTRAGSPIATPTPQRQTQALSVRPLTTPTPPVPSAPRFIPIDLLVYYDANGDVQPGAGEGVTGIWAQVYGVATNELLAQGYTDTQGRLSFTVSAQGPVRLSIPFLGFSHLITADAGAEGETSIQVRVPPRSPSGGTP